RHATYFGQELVREDRDVGLLQARRGEDVHDPFRRDGPRDDLPDRVIEFFLGPGLAGSTLGQHRLYRLEEGHVVADAQRLLVRDSQREGLRELTDRADAAVLAVLLRENVLLRRREETEALLRRTGRPLRPIEARHHAFWPRERAEQAEADLVLLQHHGHGLVLVDGRLPGTAARRVGGERRLELVRQAQVVDDEPARLVLEDPVHARYRLHQSMPAHGLVDVHRVQARRVEAGEQHVPHQHHAQRVVRVAEAVSQALPTRLVADVLLPLERVRRRPGHHDLDRARLVVALPLGPQLQDLVVELDAYPPAHAHDHGLAFHRLEALLEVLDDVARHDLQPLLRSHDRLELRPLALELLLALDLLALGDLLELGVDARALGLVQFELRQPALVVDGDRSAVLDRALDVVDADVVAEHGA